MDPPRPRDLARLVAAGRVALGAGALVAPTALARPWIGDAAAAREVRVLSRALAGRDLALGLGTLAGLAGPDAGARPWVAGAGLADAVDAVATVVAFGRLPRRTRWLVLASTVGAAAVSFRAASALGPAREGSGRT